MYMVRIMARPVMTIFGGTCCVPMALRMRANTTAIFTKEVHIMTRKGTSDSAARTVSIASGFDTPTVPAWACAAVPNMSAAPAAAAPRRIFRFAIVICTLPTNH